MTSVSSRGRTPHSPCDLASETDDSWQQLDHNSCASSSVGFLPSPASGSLNGYAVVGIAASDHASLSPLTLDLDHGNFSAARLPDHTEASAPGPSQQSLFSEARLNEFTSSLINSFQPNVPLTGLETLSHNQRHQLDVDFNPELACDVHNVDQSPWSPNKPRIGNRSSIFAMEDFVLSQNSAPTSPNHSNLASPNLKHQGEEAPSSSPIRKVMTDKIEKKKASDFASKFVLLAPNSNTARAGGQPSLNDCFEDMRTNPRDPKKPLNDAIKQNALQIRRQGACFCYHSSKIKCTKERLCKNCKRFATQVPRIICWQFSDFLTVLFPDFMRAHFRKDQMSRFMKENVDLDGMGEPMSRDVELYSGLSPVLKVRAKFFRPITSDVTQHYHLYVGQDRVDLQARNTAPMVLELDSAAQRDALKKKAKEYIAAVSSEPGYAQRVTQAIRHTDLPKQILGIVRDYATKSDSSMVQKALAIYSAHFIMTRHLCITRASVMSLQDSNLVPQDVPWVTPRVVNRQIKAVIDELLMRDMQDLFESFSKSLKPKSWREWAPCTAAFLALCLFMESVETAADTFVVALNEISMRNRTPPEYKREDALNINIEMENLPFKQFTYQFHHIYQTHSRDSSTTPFNPFIDSTWAEQGADMDAPAVDMIMRLRNLVHGENCEFCPMSWTVFNDSHANDHVDVELDLLSQDPILPNCDGEVHPFPRDVSVNYTGRMVAKFLLSFLDEKHFFGENTV